MYHTYSTRRDNCQEMVKEQKKWEQNCVRQSPESNLEESYLLHSSQVPQKNANNQQALQKEPFYQYD